MNMRESLTIKVKGSTKIATCVGVPTLEMLAVPIKFAKATNQVFIKVFYNSFFVSLFLCVFKLVCVCVCVGGYF